jgi:hypothetical protein
MPTSALPIRQQAICREVRDLIHAADPDVTETIKRTNRPYFVPEGNICALLAAKNHVNWQDGDGQGYPPIVRAELAHEAFLNIHPFYDGHGRIARLLLNLQLMRDGYPTVLV